MLRENNVSLLMLLTTYVVTITDRNVGRYKSDRTNVVAYITSCCVDCESTTSEIIMTGGGFEGFLQSKIHAVNSESEADHVIRRAFSLYRLHYEEISDGIDQVEQRLFEVIGKEWKEEYILRNNEHPRMDKTNIKSRK